MNRAEYGRMFENEDRYWWFVSRRELVMDLIGRYVAQEDPVIVDVGCGTGATAMPWADPAVCSGSTFRPWR